MTPSAPLSPVRVVVTTKDRPRELAASVAAILAQEPPVRDVTVLEGGDLDAARAALAAFAGSPVPVVLQPQERDASGRSNKSLTWERRVRPWREGLVLFVDDDVLLRPDYAARLAAALEADAAGRHAAARGQIEGRDRAGIARYDAAFATLFLLPRPGSGRIQPSGYQTHLLPPHPPRVVDTGGMGFLMVRASALHAAGFEPWFAGASTHEDMDLCLRLAAVGTLLQVPGAWVRHVHAEGGRASDRDRERMAARNHAFVWRRHLARSPFHLACLAISEVGAVVNLVADVRSPRNVARTLLGVRAWRARRAVVGRWLGWRDAVSDAWRGEGRRYRPRRSSHANRP